MSSLNEGGGIIVSALNDTARAIVTSLNEGVGLLCQSYL